MIIVYVDVLALPLSALFMACSIPQLSKRS